MADDPFNQRRSMEGSLHQSELTPKRRERRWGRKRGEGRERDEEENRSEERKKEGRRK